MPSGIISSDGTCNFGPCGYEPFVMRPRKLCFQGFVMRLGKLCFQGRQFVSVMNLLSPLTGNGDQKKTDRYLLGALCIAI